jgi:hypothetical protein
VPPDVLNLRVITSHDAPPWKPSPPHRRLTEGTPPPEPATAAALGAAARVGGGILHHRPGGGGRGGRGLRVRSFWCEQLKKGFIT